MTVTNQVSRDDYTSNGSATEYAFTFKILAEEDIQVIITDLDGVEDILELTTEYTVDLDADTSLGNITLGTAATLNFKISLLRNMDFEQNTSIQNQGTSQFAGKSFEQALDKLTLLTQQLKEVVGRNIALKKSSLLSNITIDDPVANRILVVGAAGNIEMSDEDYTDIQANLQIILDNLADINAVAADIANINLVAADLANIDIVAGISTAVSAVAAISAAVSTVAGIDSEVSTVAAISAAVSTVASISAAVSTVAGISANVTTVAGISANVTTVAGMEANIASVIANLTDIQNAASFGFPTLVSGDEGKALRINQSLDGYDAVNFPSGKNLILNGDFNVAYDGSSFTATTSVPNSDDTYIFGIWNQVSDGNDIADYSQETAEKPDGSYSSLKIDIETGNKQCGIVQFLEAKDAAALINGIASLSFEAKKGGSNSTLEKLRAAIISWSGTADSLTSDVVGTWAGAGTNPTLATNWAYENSPSDITLTTSFAETKIENISVDTASTKNVAVFIWIDDVDATVGDLAYISKIKLEYGLKSTPHIPRPIQEEIALIQRFYETSYNVGVSPATATFVGAVSNVQGGSTSNFMAMDFRFSSRKRGTPSLTLRSPSTGTVGKGYNGTTVSDLNVSVNDVGESGAKFFVNNVGVFANQDVSTHYLADARL